MAWLAHLHDCVAVGSVGDMLSGGKKKSYKETIIKYDTIIGLLGFHVHHP